MALDIGIGDGTSLAPMRTEPALALDDDAIFWHSTPLFDKIFNATGQQIDLYGNCSFAGENLPALERCLLEALAQVELQPAESPVEKLKMREMLARWIEIVHRACELARPVVCFGD